jgi:hypothetical protein
METPKAKRPGWDISPIPGTSPKVSKSARSEKAKEVKTAFMDKFEVLSRVLCWPYQCKRFSHITPSFQAGPL